MSEIKQKTPKLRFPEFTDNWEQRKLESLCDVFTDGDWIESKDQSESGVRLIQTGNVGTTQYLDKENNKKWISNETFERLKCKEIFEGDILISRLPEPAGRACVVPNLGTKMITAVDCTIVRTSEECNNKYLVQYLSTPAYFKAVNQFLGGGTRQRISRKNLSNIKVPLPKSMSEQEKIGKYFDNLDNLITLHQRKCDELKEFKKGMLQKMFPKNGEKTPEIRFPGFTDAWEQRKLGELGEISTGSTPSTANSAYYSDDGMPWVTPTDINALTISDTPRKLSEEGAKVGRVVPANTILCTCIASIGKNTLLTVKGSFNQQINSLTPYDENDAYFLLTESEIWSNTMKRMAASGTMQIVNKAEFSELKTKVPSLAEQQQIGTYFKNLDNLITLHQRKVDEYKELKKGLLQQMFI